jgi:hypothetical protein
MNPPNIKLYLILSGALLVLFLALIIVPLGRRAINQPPAETFPTPTSIDGRQLPADQSPMIETADFTGAADEELPKEVTDQINQKQDLRYRMPLSLSTFIIDFDYGEDKFTVALSEPKNQSLQEFEEWKSANYPAIPTNQFIFK